MCVYVVEQGSTAVTVSAIVPLPVRFCASAMVNGKLLGPAAVPLDTVALNEKVLSLAVVSPLVPSSKNVCVAEPPIELRSAVTVVPVLVGFVPGVTTTVSVV